MRVSEVAPGSPAASLHPAVSSTLGVPQAPAGATALNAPPPSPAPPPVVHNDTRGVQLPPDATPIASPAQASSPPAPAAPAYQGIQAADYQGLPQDAPRGLPQAPGGTSGAAASLPTDPANVNPGGTTSPVPPPQSNLPDFMNLNYNDDPILALTRLRGSENNSASAADYLKNIQSMLLAHGSRSLAQDYFDKLANDTSFRSDLGDTLWNQFQQGEGKFLDQVDANGNPDTGLSTLAQLAFANRVAGRNQDESYNQNNLFFSGAHGSAISALARKYAIDNANANTSVLSNLAAARTGLLNTENTTRDNLTNAEQAAYDRRVQEALQYQTGAAGSGENKGSDSGSGTTGGKKPPAKDPMAGPPDDRARKGATPPPPAGKKDTRPKTVVYKGRH